VRLSNFLRITTKLIVAIDLIVQLASCWWLSPTVAVCLYTSSCKKRSI